MKLKEWLNWNRLKDIPKNQLLIGGLVGILLLVIAIPVDKGKKTEGGNEAETFVKQEEAQKEVSAKTGSNYETEMEKRLTQALQVMEGVGKVEVMITLKDDGENVVEKDAVSSSQETTEEDGTVKRSSTEKQSQEETVFSQEEGSSQTPFVSKERVPQIEGVLVVAEGGGNAVVVKNISEAVLALFPVEVHKIKVVKMNL